MNYQYFGLFLNEHNRNELMKIIFANPIIANLVLQRGSTLYLDHCTLLHRNQNDKEIYDSLVKKIDESWMVEVNGICEWISIPKLNICCEIKLVK